MTTNEMDDDDDTIESNLLDLDNNILGKKDKYLSISISININDKEVAISKTSIKVESLYGSNGTNFFMK